MFTLLPVLTHISKNSLSEFSFKMVKPFKIGDFQNSFLSDYPPQLSFKMRLNDLSLLWHKPPLVLCCLKCFREGKSAMNNYQLGILYPL